MCFLVVYLRMEELETDDWKIENWKIHKGCNWAEFDFTGYYNGKKLKVKDMRVSLHVINEKDIVNMLMKVALDRHGVEIEPEQL